MTHHEKLRRINERLFAAQKLGKDERAKTARLRAALVRLLTVLKRETEAALEELEGIVGPENS